MRTRGCLLGGKSFRGILFCSRGVSRLSPGTAARGLRSLLGTGSWIPAGNPRIRKVATSRGIGRGRRLWVWL